MDWIKPEWPVSDNIHAAVTTRLGGISSGCYASLNPADHVGDGAFQVQHNRKIITQVLDLPSEPVWMQQVHGNRVIKADLLRKIEKADASYSDQVNTVCAVLTADCLPVLLSASDGSTVAAIHGGWRSLAAGIISNTIELAFDKKKVIAWLGPAIGVDNFEVGAEVRDVFIQQSVLYAAAFNHQNEQKYLADIYQLATIALNIKGVTSVYGGNFCTVTDQQRFYSYRRDGETGRMATLIWRD